MIHGVRIQNFKCLRDVSVKLERFTVFVGANGSGKTSILEAIHIAVEAATGDPQKVVTHERHGDWVYTRGGVGDLSIRYETAGGDLSLEATPPEGYPPPPDLMQKERWEYRISPSGGPLRTALEPARRMKFLRLRLETGTQLVIDSSCVLVSAPSGGRGAAMSVSRAKGRTSRPRPARRRAGE